MPHLTHTHTHIEVEEIFWQQQWDTITEMNEDCQSTNEVTVWKGVTWKNRFELCSVCVQHDVKNSVMPVVCIQADGKCDEGNVILSPCLVKMACGVTWGRSGHRFKSILYETESNHSNKVDAWSWWLQQMFHSKAVRMRMLICWYRHWGHGKRGKSFKWG